MSVTRQDMRSAHIRSARLEIEEIVQFTQKYVTGVQAPFITVYMNLGEVPEGPEREDLAKVIEEVLRQRTLGVKNEKGVYITPAFPFNQGLLQAIVIEKIGELINMRCLII